MKKKTMLEKLVSKSSKALNLVLTTIENLKSTNEVIENEKKKNEAIILGIQITNNDLSELKSSNEKIINNFENLLK